MIALLAVYGVSFIILSVSITHLAFSAFKPDEWDLRKRPIDYAFTFTVCAVALQLILHFPVLWLLEVFGITPIEEIKVLVRVAAPVLTFLSCIFGYHNEFSTKYRKEIERRRNDIEAEAFRQHREEQRQLYIKNKNELIDRARNQYKHNVPQQKTLLSDFFMKLAVRLAVIAVSVMVALVLGADTTFTLASGGIAGLGWSLLLVMNSSS